MIILFELALNIKPEKSSTYFDFIVIGGGAAGLFAAQVASQRGLTVALLEHNKRFGLKILISGGGRCNFTNRVVDRKNYLSNHPNFTRFSLAKYPPEEFIKLIEGKQIDFHEKKLGQLFCDHSSKDILNLLLDKCRASSVELLNSTKITKVSKQSDDHFHISSNQTPMHSKSLLIATGGLSYAKLGASPFGYHLAEKFGHSTEPLEPALVPLTFDQNLLKLTLPLAGVSCPCKVKFEKHEFHDDLLFTHRGISGPAILKISLYHQAGKPLSINLAPDLNLSSWLLEQKEQHPKSKLNTVLTPHLPSRLVTAWLEHYLTRAEATSRLSDISNKSLKKIANQLNSWSVTPSGTEGYKKAEATRGGVSLADISPKSMESRLVPGLFFAGEVVDVTGWLGGYNFQWAWSSGYTAGSSC